MKLDDYVLLVGLILLLIGYIILIGMMVYAIYQCHPLFGIGVGCVFTALPIVFLGKAIEEANEEKK